ncbi:putative wall-associated receptor kinase-like 16 [Silene latifolia]|uniref:putative wall-associated receptor kinase-like 16 n=1 Tax=Silene latifolia TaxID=37657 RepID=UPI003D789AFE
MFKEGLFAQFLLWTFLAILLHAEATTSSVVKRGCPAKCGNLTVPYPFGIGLDGACSIGPGYDINCNTSYDPPKAFIGNGEILDISLTDAEIRARMFIASKCYRNGDLLSPKSDEDQTHAFLGEHDKYTFNFSDLSDPGFKKRTLQNVPTVLDWTVGGNLTCEQAQKNTSSYACKHNSICIDYNVSTEGYRCNCQQGYEGNPYLGCTDIDECAGPNNPCSHKCRNVPGSQICFCRKGYHGDGYKNGSGCTLGGTVLAMWLSIGLVTLFLLSFVSFAWIYSIIKRHKLMKQRAKFFQQNGGLLLKQQTQGDSSTGQESYTRTFSPKELKIATDNYNEDRILGRGGYGMVYKGILKDGRVVAIKKSRVSDQTQIEQFINEVVILTQINHRNVVKLFGCCLETEVPLLVYEYISHGTLYEHIHTIDGTSWLNWPNCIRVASEAADAFAYLHHDASIPIIHRDIKSGNILLDENNTTKIADFGASRLIPIGQAEVTTLVQGTIGYLDPEYLLTSQLTDKSDVYSFGVVLTELLTKNRPTSPERNLSIYFVLAMKKGKLLEVVDPRFLQEASQEQLYTMANLIQRCLSVRGDDRPTMKEVAIELQGLKSQIKHLLGSKDVRPSESSTGYNPSTAEFSGQYSQQRDMIIEMNHPR